MERLSKFLLTLIMLWAVGTLAAQPTKVIDTDLEAGTLAAYARYVQATEARVKKEMARPGAFLYIDGLPSPSLMQVRRQLKRGEIFMDRLESRDASGHAIDIPDGLIHHWIGAVFIPRATLKQAIELAQDYNHHQDIYQPEVVRSKLLNHNGNDFKIFYRIRKHQVITVTLNTEHDVHYFPVDAAHEYSRSASTRIAEVENAGEPNESEKPVGHDGGFLWRIDSWWRWKEQDGGVYVECESVSLTRDIPTGLGWLIRPFVTSIPKESLDDTLGSTRAALLRVAMARQR
ncbi:MAG: hypothetical protein ACYDA9_01135 [Terriglobia bacterium]